MFCPHCGKGNEQGATYCNACGRRLPDLGSEAPPPSERPPLRRRVARLIGTGRRERLASAATVVAIAIAIAALVALGTDALSGGDDAEAEYVERADRVCAERKQALALLAEEASGSPQGSAPTVYAAAAAEVVAGWRSRLAAPGPPAELRAAAGELDEALAAVEAELRGAAAGGGGGREQLRRLGERLAAPSARAERGIEALGLEACAETPFALGGAPGG